MLHYAIHHSVAGLYSVRWWHGVYSRWIGKDREWSGSGITRILYQNWLQRAEHTRAKPQSGLSVARPRFGTVLSLLAFASTVILVSGSCGNHCHISLSRILGSSSSATEIRTQPFAFTSLQQCLQPGICVPQPVRARFRVIHRRTERKDIRLADQNCINNW
jgi:hypothetical protein